MSLYLKYRSQTFNDIIEQDYTKDILRQQVLKSFEGEQFSNYLFYGSRGIGKTSIARIVARALNCTNNTDGNPCNSCDQCLLIKSNRAIDIVEIDAASNTGVDNIRDEIINKAIYPPTQLRKKVYIIDEVHMLSTGAFNALLKIMEEPPSYLVFILATTELHKVPETIASRCQLFHFKRITQAGIVSRLEYICKNE
jgi:DNA polymerase-3 subunit gamma/tau